MDNFEEFKQQVIEEVKTNPHLYPNICKRMVQKIEDQRAEITRLTSDLSSSRSDAIEEAARVVEAIRTDNVPRIAGQIKTAASAAIRSLSSTDQREGERGW